MSPTHELKTETFEIPRNTGRAGFLYALEAILALPLVQGISIDARGKITFQRYVPAGGDELPMLALDFEKLMPYACVRNGDVSELPTVLSTPSHAIGRLFQVASRERLHPLAWVTGANTTLWEWLYAEEGLALENREELYGLPVLPDRYLEDYVLLLAAGYVRGGAISDVRKSFKIIMPQRVGGVGDALNSVSGG